MQTIIIALLLFIDIFFYMILFSVIMSWLSLFWLNFKIKFIDNLIEPVFKFVKKNIPTTFWPFDFSPIIIIFILFFIRWLIVSFYPEIALYYNNLINF